MNIHNHDGKNSQKLNYKNNKDVIHTTKNETKDGVLTLEDIPVLPATDPTTDNQMSRKAYLDTILTNTVVATDDYLQESADTERAIAFDQATYIKKKDITINESGTVRVKFDMKDDNGAGGCFGRVYKNGIEIGTEREETGGAWVTYSEDFVIISGDELQLYMKYDDGGGGVGGLTRNFRIYFYKKLTITVGTVNTD